MSGSPMCMLSGNRLTSSISTFRHLDIDRADPRLKSRSTQTYPGRALILEQVRPLRSNRPVKLNGRNGRKAEGLLLMSRADLRCRKDAVVADRVDETRRPRLLMLAVAKGAASYRAWHASFLERGDHRPWRFPYVVGGWGTVGNTMGNIGNSCAV